MACRHSRTVYFSSSQAATAGYKPRTRAEITRAAGLDQAQLNTLPGPTTYPGPLVLPEDELAWDPDYPEQDLASAKRCMNTLSRNPGGRHVVYVAAAPSITRSSPKRMKDWTQLRLPKEQRTNLIKTPKPRTQDVLGYISAFYHGLPVKLLDEKLSFVSWDDEMPKPMAESKGPSELSAVAIQTSKEAIRIRCRQLAEGLCVSQLNLNDLLDVAISILPKDAYALLMLVDHDLYEDENDDFCCGRAYGGSRVACVSTFRYHPAADIEQDVDLEHAWPVSHCADYVERLCSDLDLGRPKKKARNDQSIQGGPLRAAMDAYPKDLDSMTLEAYAGL